jgi:hypothetical protein
VALFGQHVTSLILRFFFRQDLLQVESAATCATTAKLAAETGLQIQPGSYSQGGSNEALL